MKIPKHAQPNPASAGDPRDEQHPPARVEPEDHRHEHRHAAVDAGAGRDPQRLGGDELLGVDRRGEDRVVGALELVLDERRVHGRERAGEQHRRGHDPGAHEVDVVVAGDRADERAEAEAERQQVDRRVDRRGERRRAPERRVVHDLADHHALERGALEAAEAALCAGDRHQVISSPVSSTKTSSRLVTRRSPSRSVAPLACRTATEVPVRRVRQPRAWAMPSTSVSRVGDP